MRMQPWSPSAVAVSSWEPVTLPYLPVHLSCFTYILVSILLKYSYPPTHPHTHTDTRTVATIIPVRSYNRSITSEASQAFEQSQR